jgi:hypothetical protein
VRRSTNPNPTNKATHKESTKPNFQRNLSIDLLHFWTTENNEAQEELQRQLPKSPDPATGE